MKIQGVIEVEGIKLHIDIDAPDNHQDIYVANVHPNCLVVPKERWYIEYLDLSVEAVKELKQQQINNLGQLTNGQWQISREGLSEQTNQELVQALECLRQMAILFEQPTPEVLVGKIIGRSLLKSSEKESLEQQSNINVEQVKTTVDLNTPIEYLPISVKMREILKAVHVRTLADVLEFGKSRLTMTIGVTRHDIEELETGLSRLGHPLPDNTQRQKKEISDV